MYPLPTTGTRAVRCVCPHDCPDTCGMVVTVTDGVATHLRGDPNHSFTRGFLCTKVSRYLERTYHPERLTTPLLRTGPKGSGQFRPIGWSEAIQRVADALNKARHSAHGPQSILPYSYAGTMGKLQGSSLDRRLFHAIGASLLDRTICATAGAVGCGITLGTRAVVDSEALDSVRLFINWGSNTAVTNSHLWVRMLEAQRRGAQIITIDPFQSRTAERSDQWLAIRPGTDAALALAIAHVLLRDNLVDHDYLASHASGLEPFTQRALTEYSPWQASEICGLDESTIEALAHAYGTTRPALIRLNYGLQRHGGGGMAVRAITCLPALTGDWRYPGAGALLSTSQIYPTQADSVFQRADLIPPGTRTINMTRLAEALEGHEPGPPVNVLVVYNANPASVCPDQGRVVRGLQRDDLFTVVLEHFQTDTARYADIVLPATTQLEHWDIHTSYGHLNVQINEPAIAPVGESLPNTEIFRRLGRALDLHEGLFASTDLELIDEVLTETPRGAAFPPAGALSGITRERLLAEGPVRLNVPSPYLPFAEGGFGTADGRCNLWGPEHSEHHPRYTPPHEDPRLRPDLSDRYPLQMVSPPEPSFLNSSFANVASLKAIAGSPRLLIHPADAAPRGIANGQKVRVFNDRGAFEARAEVGEKSRAGVVVAPGIWWSRDSKDGANANATTSTRLTDMGGGATFFDNLVEVAPITHEATHS